LLVNVGAAPASTSLRPPTNALFQTSPPCLYPYASLFPSSSKICLVYFLVAADWFPVCVSSRLKSLLHAVSVCAAQVLVAQKVAVGVYKGVTTSELDELAAETAASMTSKHPDYAQVRRLAHRARTPAPRFYPTTLLLCKMWIFRK